MNRPSQARQGAATGSDLARLLQTEERLERLLAAAREEAARIIQVAGDELAAAEKALEGELKSATASLGPEVQRRLEAESAEILACARREAAGLAAIDPGRIEELAGYVLDGIAGEEAP